MEVNTILKPINRKPIKGDILKAIKHIEGLSDFVFCEDPDNNMIVHIENYLPQQLLIVDKIAYVVEDWIHDHYGLRQARWAYSNNDKSQAQDVVLAAYPRLEGVSIFNSEFIKEYINAECPGKIDIAIIQSRNSYELKLDRLGYVIAKVKENITCEQCLAPIEKEPIKPQYELQDVKNQYVENLLLEKERITNFGGKDYTNEQLANEIKENTLFGKELVKDLFSTVIKLLLLNKVEI